jgi:hypothetical protein
VECAERCKKSARHVIRPNRSCFLLGRSNLEVLLPPK